MTHKGLHNLPRLFGLHSLPPSLACTTFPLNSQPVRGVYGHHRSPEPINTSGSGSIGSPASTWAHRRLLRGGEGGEGGDEGGEDQW